MPTDRLDAIEMPRQGGSRWCWAGIAALVLAGCASAPRSDSSRPLLRASENLFYVHTDRNERSQGDILASLTLLGGLSQRYAASDPNCREAECRKAFSDALGELGTEYARLGLDRVSLRYYELALANVPDSAFNHVNLAIAQLALGRDEAALESIGRALELGKDDATTESAAARILLMLDRRQAAIEHADACIRKSSQPRMAQYCALTAMLAKLRGGTDRTVAPLVGGEAAWPAPLLDYLRGKISESVLTTVVMRTSDPAARREGLSEALYYVGEAELARGHRDLALRYFRANLKMKIEASWGTTASRRYIREFGSSDDPRETEPPPSHIPIS